MSASVERAIVSSLLVVGPARPTHPAIVAKYEAAVGAGYATRAPLGDDRHEYKITAAGGIGLSPMAASRRADSHLGRPDRRPFPSGDPMKTTRITGHAAINAAALDPSIALNKYADPTEGERLGITMAFARDVAGEVPDLIWADVPAPLSISELEAASNAATAAYHAARVRLGSLDRLADLLSRIEDIDGLTPEDESDIASLRARSSDRRPALFAECDRLEDVANAAARALNAAPEEAA